MKVLVIKQTSLGDVLHASGHVRAIKEAYPQSELYLMTATTSEDIYRYSPWVDHFILIDRNRVKKEGYRRPVWAIRYMMSVLNQVRKHEFDIAFDLQGLAKSVFFLYFAHAKQKFVKGNWWGIKGFRDKRLHAIRELDKVLEVAQVPIDDTTMEFNTGESEKATVREWLDRVNRGNKPLIIMSPFSRWLSKDWPLENYVALSNRLSNEYLVVFTGASDRQKEIATAISDSKNDGVVNLAGKLDLVEFAELCGKAICMVTGDSFPMHVSGAKKTPVLALFGPTDDKKVGPLGDQDIVMVAKDCDRCDRRNCKKLCLQHLSVDDVMESLNRLLRSLRS